MIRHLLRTNLITKSSQPLLRNLKNIYHELPFLNAKSLHSQPIRQFSSNLALKSKFLQTSTYSHLSGHFFEEAEKASKHLLSFDNELLEKILKNFHENFLNPNSRSIIPNNIMLILKGHPKYKDQLEVQASYEIFKSLKTIVEFIDKAEKGLLVGDISQRLLIQIKKSMHRVLPYLSEDRKMAISTEKRDSMINLAYNQICQVAFEGLFRLPANGIVFPEYENPKNLFERQLVLEDETNDMAINKFLNTYESLDMLGMTHQLKFAKTYIVQWFPSLCRLIKEEQELCLLGGETRGDRKIYGNFLTKLPAEQLALLSLTELMKFILKLVDKRKDDEGSWNAYHIVSKLLFAAIGKALNTQLMHNHEEAVIRAKEDKLKGVSPTGEPKEDSLAQIKRQKQIARKVAQLTNKLMRRKMDTSLYKDIGIPADIQIKLGSLLVFLIKESTRISTENGFKQPLLTTSYAKVKGKKKQFVGVLNVNEEFILDMIEQIEQSGSMFIQIERCLPMIYKPAPWQDHEIGGYYQKPTNLMRIHESMLQERSIKFADLQPTFNVLDIISETPWRINKKVLKVVEAIWEEGGGAGEIPLRHYNYENYVYQYQLQECKDYAEKSKLMKKIQMQRDIHSLRCDFTLKLNVAKAFLNMERIYFPHNIDFRGRIYPIPPHMNHISADICRGMLEFAEGKPIGKKGIYWLKIHLANKMGKDKLNFKDRLLFVDSNLSVIERCVTDPLKFREWLEFEDCWQTLAAMFDLQAALNMDNPEDYVSHIHIHQDGSCNGLQHYAALGRDIGGANQVNLNNTDKPGDVYTHVANMVQSRVNADAKDAASPYHRIANKLVGNVKRKIVKQTVMTSVYGVTFIGARKQIAKQLKDKEYLDEVDTDVPEASYYLATLTLDSIRDLFSGAHEIKKWLIQCAGLIADTANPVSWITPLGLPVVQPYRSSRGVDIIQTIIQRVAISTNSDNLPINKPKQRSAFPPNYIHSLDSTHLMYTALQCKKEGITFAAVHDSYWTHAGTIDRMNELLRDEFIRLHSQPLLENLKESFVTRFPQIDFPEIPARGEFRLENVKKSLYFFA
jgi:DNA-directed RNA polymerase